MDAVHRYPHRRMLAVLAAAAVLAAGAAWGSDEDVFRYRAYPNLLILLDRGSDMSVNDNVSVQDIDGDGSINRYDVALKVLFRILNADGGKIDNNSTPPRRDAVTSYRNSLITVDDELYLAQRIGLVHFDNAAHYPSGPPFQVYPPDRPPNLPPYLNASGESWMYISIWDNVDALGPPGSGSPSSFPWDAIRNYFDPNGQCLFGDNNASCRPKVTVLIITPDSFDASNGRLGSGMVDNSYNPFFLIVGSPATHGKKALFKDANNIPEGRIAVFSSDADIENSVIFEDLVAQLQATTFEFVAPVVPAVRTSDSNVLFVASFTPATGSGSARALWPGHLVSFDLNEDGSIPSPIVTNWDAHNRLASRSTARNIYTSSNGSRLDFTTSSVTAAMLGVATDGARDNVIDTVRSLSLGDIFHATPVVVGAPSRYYADLTGIDARQQFVNDYAHRKRIIIAGANDGMLHAFNAGNFDATLAPPGYTRGTGDEEWAYIPGFLLGNVKNFSTSPSVHNYYIDSAPAVADIWVDSTPSDYTDGKRSAEWHTVVVGGAGKGGKGYYALDITNPGAGASSYPTVLWEKTNASSPASDWQYLGQTWSTPAIGKIRKSISVSGNDYVYDQWLAIVGGGMGVPTGNAALSAAVNLNYNSGWPRVIASVAVTPGTGNAPSSGSVTISSGNRSAVGTYTSRTTTTFDNVLFQDPGGSSRYNYPIGSTVSWGGGTEGNAILILDAWTGAIVQRLSATGMQSITAPPTILNNSYGYIERVYVGDLNGNLWRATIDNTATWSLGGAPFFTVTGSTYSKKINSKAAVFGGAGSYVGSTWVAFGTGDRESPMDTTSGSKGAVVVVKDADTFDQQHRMTTTTKFDDSASGLADLSGFLAASSINSDSATFNPGASGWFAALPNTGEKMLSSPTVFNSNIFFTTFEPQTGDCQVGGTARIYGFGVLTGSYALYSDSAAADQSAQADRRMRAYAAAGIPSSPVVSVGSTGVATLYFGTTGSSVKSLKIPSPTTSKTLKYWREVH